MNNYSSVACALLNIFTDLPGILNGGIADVEDRFNASLFSSLCELSWSTLSFIGSRKVLSTELPCSVNYILNLFKPSSSSHKRIAEYSEIRKCVTVNRIIVRSSAHT